MAQGTPSTPSATLAIRPAFGVIPQNCYHISPHQTYAELIRIVPKNAHNPLLSGKRLPEFSRIRPEHIVPAVDELLGEARCTIARLTETASTHTWESLAQPLEDLDDMLNRSWSPVGHLHAVADDPQLREAFNTCLPKLSAYATDVGQNEKLYRGYEGIAKSEAFATLDRAQRKTVQNALRDFRLAGVSLRPEEKKRYKQIAARLAELSAKFGENVLDATQAWTKHVTDETELSGLPPTALGFARETAEREELSGWLLTLEAPSYLPVVTYADNGALRQEIYTASTTRASDQGPNAGQWNNGDVMEEILMLRHEKALLLGFDSYAECSLATKMARSPRDVIGFLGDLAARIRPIAQRELEELRGYARSEHDVAELHAWDIAYFSEKLRERRWSVTQEQLRPYFPVPQVLKGLFAVVNRLYGLQIDPRQDVDVWDPEVRFFTIRDSTSELRGEFYLDLYSRSHKRGGAWMDECAVRKRNGSVVQTPVAYLTCNFTPSVGGDPSLLTHDEVTTLFHEFGHGLHHLLTRVDCPSVSGINGVEWDAVELPSQIMENWCWEREALELISSHYQTHERLSDEMFEKLHAGKNFQSGLKMLRQIEFALFDFRLHLEYDPRQNNPVQRMLDDVRAAIAVMHPPEFNRFAHSFSHIFGGGYAAGYYSYLWAEVLSADAFSRFEESGIFDRQTGLDFLHSVLEQGGARAAMDSFVEFRGREPKIDALLRRSGIAPILTRERSA